MLQIRDFTPDDRNIFLEMCRDFYQSPAVLHPVPEHVAAANFTACLSGSPLLRGLILADGEGVAGYALLTFTHSGEVGGLVVMVDEVFLQARARGKGYGTAFFTWLFAEYEQTARRFRLEVTGANPAAALYERLGFTPLPYRQMVRDITVKEEQ